MTPVGFVGSFRDCETEILFNLNGTEPEQILRIRFVLFRMSFSVFGFQVCLCGGSGKTRKEQMKTFSNIHWNNRFISIQLESHSNCYISTVKTSVRAYSRGDSMIFSASTNCTIIENFTKSRNKAWVSPMAAIFFFSLLTFLKAIHHFNFRGHKKVEHACNRI